jgi:hypothetical protein
VQVNIKIFIFNVFLSSYFNCALTHYYRTIIALLPHNNRTIVALLLYICALLVGIVLR